MADNDSDSKGDRFILTGKRDLKLKEISISEEELKREWRYEDKRLQKMVILLTIIVHIEENVN